MHRACGPAGRGPCSGWGDGTELYRPRGAQHVWWRQQHQPRHMSPMPVGRLASTAGRLELSAEAEGPPRCEQEATRRGPEPSAARPPPPCACEVDGKGRGWKGGQLPSHAPGRGRASSKASTQAKVPAALSGAGGGSGWSSRAGSSVLCQGFSDGFPWAPGGGWLPEMVGGGQGAPAPSSNICQTTSCFMEVSSM